MRFLILFLVLLNFSFGKTIVSYYKVGYAFFDEVAKAKAIYQNIKDRYHIKIEAKAVGFLSAFSNRVESYESFGDINNSILIPKKFINYRKNGSKVIEKIYTFDHKNRVVFKIENKRIDNKIVSTKKSKLKFYAKDDILTLFFNLKYLDTKKDKFQLYAVGGNKKDGHIDIIRPTSSRERELNRLFKNKRGDFLIAILYRKIFLSNRGELIIKLDKDALCKEAVLKDVLFYGDIRGEMVKKDIF